MMKVRWSPEAVKDLRSIFNHIQKDSQTAAEQVIQTIYAGCSSLTTSPHRGRLSRIRGWRELVFAPLPYIAVYRVRESEQSVEISRIYHGAQNWP